MTTASRDRLIHVFDLSNKFSLVQTLDDHSSSITCVKFADGGNILASCAADKSLIFRSLGGTLEYSTYHNASGRSTVYDMDVDPTSKFIATVSQDRRLNIHSVRSGKPLRSYRPEDEAIDNGGGAFLKVSLDPSGLFAVTASSDKIIRVFDFYSGACIGRMVGHSEIITCVVFSGDGTRIISAGGDGCVFVWKLAAELVLQIRNRIAQIQGGSFVPDIASPASSPQRDDVDVASTPESFSETHKATALKGSVSTSGFVFRYSETGLPSWARSGYDPQKSISATSKKAPIPASGTWAEVFF